jgi:predicted alpha/beta-hydrolase family hydrolase
VRRLPLLLILLAALAGCGGSGTSYPDRATETGPIGTGANGVWVFEPAGKPKDVVVFFHGQGDAREATPVNHRPWIDHLVERGSLVIYPRYELTYEPDPIPFVVKGVRTAMQHVDTKGLPVLAIGYSRGGGLVVEYGAFAKQNGLPVPNAIMAVFPAGQGDERRIIPLRGIDPTTAILLQIGEDDNVVAGGGARFLLSRLKSAGFPASRIQVDLVRSQQGLVSNHFAPLQTTPAAKAEFWGVADRMLSALD